MSNPDNDHLKPLRRIGGNDSIEGLAITKPKPRDRGQEELKLNPCETSRFR